GRGRRSCRPEGPRWSAPWGSSRSRRRPTRSGTRRTTGPTGYRYRSAASSTPRGLIGRIARLRNREEHQLGVLPRVVEVDDQPLEIDEDVGLALAATPIGDRK